MAFRSNDEARNPGAGPRVSGDRRRTRIPYRLGQVLEGDDPFNGRCLGTVAVLRSPYVGLRTGAPAAGRIVFYDYRQLRHPD